MSLVGNLEDLGLGEILQIVGLSGRSGRITLKTPHGDAWIWLEAGQVRAAGMRGAPASLRELLEHTKAVEPARLAPVAARCEDGVELGRRLVEDGLLEAAALEQLRLAHTQHVLREIFRWSTGDFLYENAGAESAAATGLVLEQGLSAQFVALECARLDDEDTLRSTGPLVAGAAETAPGAGLEGPAPDGDAAHAPQAEPEGQATPAATDGDGDQPAAGAEGRPPVVVLDASLAVLEWVKGALADRFPRIHIFQRSELAIDRIRQYLRRGETPLVLLAEDAPRDSLTGADGGAALAARLRSQAARMPVVLLTDEPAASAAANGLPRASRPPLAMLADGADPGALEGVAETLCAALESALSPDGASSA